MKKIISMIILFAMIISMVACSTIEPEKTEEKKEKTKETKQETVLKTEETETETSEDVPVTTKKEHTSIDQYQNEQKDKPIQTVANPFEVVKNIDGDSHLQDMKNNYIDGFTKSYTPADEGKILFYGHSHFTRWSEKHDGNKNLKDMITSSTGDNSVCINHGFGSSTMYDLCYFYNEAVKPWKPKVMVITSYVNDSQYSVSDIIILTDWLMNKISKDFPDTKVFLTDYPPVARDRSTMLTRLNELNAQLKKVADKYSNVTLVELSKEPAFYNSPASAGSYMDVNKSLYLADEIHFTQAGYDVLAGIYKRILSPYLG